jgi:hypothetical protein
MDRIDAMSTLVAAVDEGSLAAASRRLRANLQYLHRERGTVEKLGAGRGTTWAIRA